ncbi:glucose/arabinose dehydrogenase [Agromyces ramosus]|uniref:Glucose/arabinose dehydrogenase n=1 Tax=Agromyces ramosus TaxID=33879 RepID=A0A4Q7M886_9MICO|nr:PQQ-dependent sugar dehydrogenase [Agromyces ramosus]RZS64295.1 glucose/arabinose dehydrogenase [Agromyces ramosus]
MREAAHVGNDAARARCGGAARPAVPHARRDSSRASAVATAVALCLALAGCVAAPPERSPLPSTPPGSPSSTPTPAPAAPTPTGPPPVLQPNGGVGVVAQGLQAPWSILRLPAGGVLVSERDTANIVEVLGDGSLRVAATVAEVAPGGEGGLLGLAFRPTDGDDPAFVYAYFTAASDNRIVRMPLTGAPGSLGLGAPEDVLTGIPKAGNHNGGRIAFGPDGFLYATAGDAGNRDAAQDPNSLSGKILRMTAEGRPAPGNPYGNFTWSFGHRNPQGLAWDAAGDLWAAEFGQNTWDELNRITRGANYGWPVVEGQAGDARFVDPAMQWSTAEASPSGLAIVGDTLFLAALRGERLWAIAPATTGAALASTPWFTGELGRIRDVTEGPDGELWFIGNNTDGRGAPSPGDDRLFRVRLAPA